MKLHATTHQAQAVGFGETHRFGFEMNAMAFHAVIDGIYSNKIEAPVREYATNAYDAHRMVGKDDVPFELMAPSTFHPYFMVRDYGPGMTHEEVTERATTMFASDKRDTNDLIGFLGLGMKSGFSYTKQYTITCYDGETQRDYVCFLDEAGAPTVSGLKPVPSDEPRGVKVSFPVQQGDIAKFQHAISKVMIGFDPMPRILNEQWQPNRPVDLMQGSNFRVVRSDYIKIPHVQQGCVLYPLDLTQIDGDYGDRQIPIIIDIPVGTASVSTSREQLGYDEVTKDNLRKIWFDVKDEFRRKVQNTLNGPDNFHDACIRYRDLKNSLPSNLVPSSIKWRDQYELRATFPHNGSPGTKVRIALLPAGDTLEWVTVRQPRGYYRLYSNKPSFTPERMKQLIPVWQSDDCDFGKDRMRRFRSENPDVDILWIKTTYVEDFTEIYGIEDVVDLADYERLKLPRSPRQYSGLKKTDIRLFDRFRTVRSNFELDQEVIYVRSEGAKYKIFDKVVDYDVINNRFLQLAKKVSPEAFDRPIIVLMKNQTSFAKSPKWRSLEDVLKEIASTFEPKEFRKKEEVRRIRQEPLVWDLAKQKENLPKRLQSFFEALNKEPPRGDQTEDLSELWRRISGKELPSIGTYWKDRWERLIERYPLLSVARHNDEHLEHYLKLISR